MNIDTMTGIELREAVARRLGWHESDCGGWHHGESTSCQIEPPPFDTSLDAHSSPGGTVEAFGRAVDHIQFERNSDGSCYAEIALDHSPPFLPCGHGSTHAEALCRAFLKATGGQ